MNASFLRNAKRFVCLPVAIALTMAFCACAQPQAVQLPTQDFSSVDFSASPYKHTTNGGLTSDPTMPYNIDAITGATLTVEGPAVEVSIPLSVRELENQSEGLFRAVYTDSTGAFIYEGLDIYHLIHNMIEGDNGIILTDKAYSVVFKDANRADIATFTIDEIIAAHQEQRPILLAYGIGTADEKTIAPFVFDAANEQERSEGYVEALQNGDGCLKLVYDLAKYPGNASYTAFSNAAYVYVREQTEPGFKHTTGEYSGTRYTDYIISFRGSALKAEMNFTLRQLEALVSHDAQGVLIKGGVGYSDFYSLANNAYWYVNEYEGLDLYKLLLYLGMDDAETMGLAAARTTLVSFVANDGVPAHESFSVDTLSYPDAFGYYNKNAADQGDGKYVSTNADLVATGYPVLLAYGVNRYPYTIAKNDAGYLSGLSNSGGPIRVVFGKTQYGHANGSNQVQYLKEVIVGDNVLYNTHKYTDVPAQNAHAADALTIAVYKEDATPLMEKTMTVGELEDILYGADVNGALKKAAQVKDCYQAGKNGTFYTDVYEGVRLEHLLMTVLGLPGTNGTATFTNGTEEVTINLDALLQNGFNTELGREDLPAMLAFAKNGSPMVPAKESPGYVNEIALQSLLTAEPAAYTVKNSGGPLALLIPSTNPVNCDARTLFNVTGITINLVPDAYAHIEVPYNASAQNTLRLFGEGLEQEFTYTIGQIEGKQTKTKTLDYSVLNNKGELIEQRYRGIAVYELFTEIGIKSNAGDVIVHASDGTSYTFPLSQLKKQNYANYIAPEKPALFAMLAYGAGTVGADSMLGMPLVQSNASAGYDNGGQNDGGPLKLVIPQEDATHANAALCVKDVAAIEVTANDIDTWGHTMSDVYSEFLDDTLTFTIRNDDSEWTQEFTVAQIEAMEDIIVREKYTVLDLGECEGIDIWKFIQKFAKNVPGMDAPVSITAYANDGYKNDLLSVFYKEGFELGVPDADGNRKPLIIAYALNGSPLVDDESHEGYTGLAGNTAGPLRVVAETNQGASVKYMDKLVVTVPGTGAIAGFIEH